MLQLYSPQHLSSSKQQTWARVRNKIGNDFIRIFSILKQPKALETLVFKLNYSCLCKCWPELLLVAILRAPFSRAVYGTGVHVQHIAIGQAEHPECILTGYGTTLAHKAMCGFAGHISLVSFPSHWLGHTFNFAQDNWEKIWKNALPGREVATRH